MDTPLNTIETRVLGSLIEKEITTPHYYPLTLNALTNACNQKNNRDPLVEFDDTTVLHAIDNLRNKTLVSTITGAGYRVQKYKHNFATFYHLSHKEIVVLCLLMLRGPQTAGELRNRSGSMHTFGTVDEVETTIIALSAHVPPLVIKLARAAGQKEVRYTHLLSGQPSPLEIVQSLKPEKAVLKIQTENERIALIEEQVKTLKGEIEKLNERFDQFKKEFE
ncbi:MAG: YceH family protein [Bacteroidota bacterium]